MKYRYPRLNAEMPSKEEVLKLTPNPATRELVDRLGEEGVESYLDRFEAQQPLCGFGLGGLCCQRCLWGPCRISPKAPRGTCGNDANLVIIGNLLRGMAAGCAAHGRHAQEVIETLIQAAEGRINFPILGEARVLDLARRFGLVGEEPSAAGRSAPGVPVAGSWAAGKTVRELAGEVGRILLEDLARTEDRPMRTLLAFAPPERVEVWSRLGILPRSAMYEVFEAMHVTTVGSCSDWKALARQDLRTALAYCYSTLFGSSLGAEMLFGIPEPREVELEAGYGVLREDHVNILLHGHSPIMAEKVVEKAGLPEMQALAREAGARGIRLGGMCCTGNELLNRYGIPPVTNILGAEMALATGAVDALVIDMQCAIPGLQAVAGCFGTPLITTCASNRFPGDTYVGWTAEDLDGRALEVVRTAIAAYRRRAGGSSSGGSTPGEKNACRVRIPTGTGKAVAGWSVESIFRAFARGAAGGRDGYGPQGSVTHRHLAGSGASTGRRSPPDDAAAVRAGRARLWQLIREGRIKGIVSIAGCNSPKVPFENGHVTIARMMVEWGALVLTTGCASYALLNAGLASREAAELNEGGLGEVCREYGIPPVLAVGACTDNTRMVRLYTELAEEAGLPLPRMPFCHSGPEPGSEKNIGQGVHFLCHGITVHQGFPGGIPVPIPRPAEDARYLDDLTVEVTGVARFFAVEAMEVLGARVINEPYPKLAAKAIQMHLHRQRQGLSG